MKIIEPYVIVPKIDGKRILKNLERYARICYKSEDKTGENTAERLLASIIKRGHESVIEHEKVTVIFVCDRGISHEIVRHRIASFSQESTRYCNYSGEKFGKEITVIRPFFFEIDSREYNDWKYSCSVAEEVYTRLIEICKRNPQEARSVLPHSLKTEIAVTFNIREWRHFFKLRCAFEAHPQMRQLAIPLLAYFRENIPVLFDDIPYQKYRIQFLEYFGDNFAEIRILEDELDLQLIKS